MNWYKKANKLQINIEELKNIASMTQEEFAANPPSGYKWKPNKSGEADRNTPGITTIGPNFFDLGHEARMHILVHELAHDIADEMFLDGSAWDLLDAKLLHNPLYQGEEIIPGKTFHFYGANRKPDEAISDAIADIVLNPDYIQQVKPELYNVLKRKVDL